MDTARDRTADLDKLADAVIANLEDGGDRYFVLDGKRPFGDSAVEAHILRFIGADPESYGGHLQQYSADQEDYARDLWGDVLTHIKDRWRAMRAGDRG